MPKPEVLNKIIDIFHINREKDWVRSYLAAEKAPIKLYGKSAYSVQKLGIKQTEYGTVVYPKLIDNNGDLTELDDDSAYQNAKDTNQLVSFDTPEEAKWFLDNYKAIQTIGGKDKIIKARAQKMADEEKQSITETTVNAIRNVRERKEEQNTTLEDLLKE